MKIKCYIKCKLVLLNIYLLYFINKYIIFLLIMVMIYISEY